MSKDKGGKKPGPKPVKPQRPANTIERSADRSGQTTKRNKSQAALVGFRVKDLNVVME